MACKLLRYRVMQVRAVLDRFQEIRPGRNSKTVSVFFSELEYRKGLGPALAIVKPNLGLPEAQRLRGSFMKMYPRHPADIV